MYHKAFRKIARHGNSAMVAIPREMLFHVGVMFGDYVWMETTEDGAIVIRNGENRTNLRDANAPRTHAESAAAKL